MSLSLALSADGVLEGHTKLRWLCAPLCLILCNPMDCSPPGSSVHGIFQARILQWVAIFLQGTFSTQGLNPYLLCLLHCKRILYHLSHQESHTELLNKQLEESLTCLVSGMRLRLAGGKDEMHVFRKT